MGANTSQRPVGWPPPENLQKSYRSSDSSSRSSRPAAAAPFEEKSPETPDNSGIPAPDDRLDMLLLPHLVLARSSGGWILATSALSLEDQESAAPPRTLLPILTLASPSVAAATSVSCHMSSWPSTFVSVPEDDGEASGALHSRSACTCRTKRWPPKRVSASSASSGSASGAWIHSPQLL